MTSAALLDQLRRGIVAERLVDCECERNRIAQELAAAQAQPSQAAALHVSANTGTALGTPPDFFKRQQIVNIEIDALRRIQRSGDCPPHLASIALARLAAHHPDEYASYIAMNAAEVAAAEEEVARARLDRALTLADIQSPRGKPHEPLVVGPRGPAIIYSDPIVVDEVVFRELRDDGQNDTHWWLAQWAGPPQKTRCIFLTGDNGTDAWLDDDLRTNPRTYNEPTVTLSTSAAELERRFDAILFKFARPIERWREDFITDAILEIFRQEPTWNTEADGVSVSSYVAVQKLSGEPETKYGDVLFFVETVIDDADPVLAYGYFEAKKAEFFSGRYRAINQAQLDNLIASHEVEYLLFYDVVAEESRRITVLALNDYLANQKPKGGDVAHRRAASTFSKELVDRFLRGDGLEVDPEKVADTLENGAKRAQWFVGVKRFASRRELTLTGALEMEPSWLELSRRFARSQSSDVKRRRGPRR